MVENIDEGIDIYISNKDKKKKREVIKVVMRYISACLNTNGGIVKLYNHHWERAIGKDLDEWYGDVEKKLFSDSTKFIEFEGRYNEKILYLRIKPLHYIFSVDTYLYFPRNSNIVEARYPQTIDILLPGDKSGSLSELLDVKEVFEYQNTLSTLSENDQIQFKEIKSKNIPSTFSSMINPYISAFSNHKGGRIFFGIEDKTFKVVGVELTEEDKQSIIKLMYDKMKNTMKWGCDNHGDKTYKNGTHWSIDFLPLKKLQKPILTEKGKALEVIMVSVCRYPGGVFTDTPTAYYIKEENRTIHQFTFKECKDKMISSYKGTPFTKRCGEELKTSVDHLYYLQSETYRNVLSLGEMLSGTASDSTVMKDRFESRHLASKTSNRTRGTDVLQEESNEISQVPSNLQKHHVTHDYKITGNDKNLKEILKNQNCVTVKGYIGTGKSQLVLCYGLHYKMNNNLVWKFDCSSIQELLRSTAYLLKELGFKIKYTDNKTEDILLMAKNIEKFLETNHIRFHILIFEDVVDDSRYIVQKFINVYLAKKDNLKILVTSSFSVTKTELEISGFSEGEAIDFIDDIKASHEERAELVKTFSCNPLGLKIATRYINCCHISVGAFLEKLTSPKGALDIENSQVISHHRELRPLFQSLHLILSDIHTKSPSTLLSITLMQFLGSDKIPVNLLENAHDAHLSLLSVKSKEEGSCNSTFGRINDVISTLEHYSFASVRALDDNRVIHTHRAILLAIENYTSEAVDSSEITIADMLKALLLAVICLIHKDNRIKTDFERHTYLLPYAESILNRTRELLENTDEAKTKQFMDISFYLSLLYVSDIVGYTYDFNEMYHFGEDYFNIAESYLIKMVGLSMPMYCSSAEDIQIKANETASQLHQKLTNIYKQNQHMIDTVGQWYVLKKHRPKEELEIVRKGIPQARKQINKTLGNVHILNLLCDNQLAVPKELIGHFFFFEFVISFLYSYGRRLFYTIPQDTRHNCYLLYIAEHLSSKVHELNPRWKMVHHLLTKRSGTIQLALLEKSDMPQKDLKDLKDIAEQCLSFIAEKNTYFLCGIICLDTENDEFNKIIWLKQLVRCYKTMITKANYETEKEEIKERGQEHVKHLEELIKAFEHTSAFPSLLLCIGEFYQCIRDFQSAKTTFKKLFPKLTQAEQKVKTRKNDRKSYIYYLQCLLLEPKDTRSEQIESETCKEIEMLVPVCYKYLINHKELDELEELLFMSEQDSLMKHEQRACWVYLDSRLSHLQNGGLNEDVYNQHVMEITELLDKYSKMPLNHTESGLGDMEIKLSDLRKKHNS